MSAAAPTGRMPPTPHLGRRRPVAVDLFAGVGGFSLGFEQAGFDVVAALEWDPVHAAAHSYNFPRTAVVCADAVSVSYDELARAIEQGVTDHGNTGWNGDLDAVFGGPPCQGFSAGGKRHARDDRNLLVFDFARLTIRLRPRYFAFENVPPIKTFADPDHPGSTLFERFRAEFERAGYRLLDPRVLNASRYGVPQDRRRLILIGAREDVPLPAYPTASVSPVPKRSADQPREGEFDGATGPQKLPRGPTVADAIADLPAPEQFEELWLADSADLDRDAVDASECSASSYARQLRGIDDDPDDLSYPRIWERARLTASMLTRHEPDSISRFAATAPGAREATSRFLRLDPLGLCATLRAGTGYDRGSFMAPRPIHPSSPRVITVREAARLHSLPDWFRLHVTKWHGFRQIGNALPPRLGRAIAREFIQSLELRPPRPSEAMPLGDPTLLALSTSGAAARLGVKEGAGPSHKLRTRKRRTATTA